MFLALGQTDTNDRFRESASRAGVNDFAIQSGRLADSGGPQFVTERIINNAHQCLVTIRIRRRWPTWFRAAASFGSHGRTTLERDGNAGVWDGVGEIDSAINRIHHPAVCGSWIPGDSFLSERTHIRKGRAQSPFNHFLAPDIEFQFDVTLCDHERTFRSSKLPAH